MKRTDKDNPHISAEEFALRFPTPESLRKKMLKARAARVVQTHAPIARTARTIVAISDVHRPKFDKATWRIFLRMIRDIRPDGVWIVGDYVDLSSVNRHEKAAGDTYTLGQELWDGNEGLDEISDAIGKRAADLLYIDGNHEARLSRYLASGRCPPELRDTIHEIPDELHLRRRGWRYVPSHRQPHYPFRRFAVTHGHWYNLHAAHKHAMAFGMSGLMGHTHRYQVYTTWNAHGPVVWTVMPTARDPYAEWQHQGSQVFTGWTTGLAVIEVLDEVPHVRAVLTHGGAATYGGQTWRA